MRIWISLCFLALICPRNGLSETSKDLVELFPTGCINWTKGVLEAKGLCPPDSSQSAGAREAPQQQAQRLAAENALNTLKIVRLDANRNVVGMLSSNPDIGAKVKQMTDTASVVQELRLADGAWEVTIRIDLLGGLAQLLLPEEVKQVESIKSMPAGGSRAKEEPAPAVESPYTGLIVDARGIGAKPALVPLLVDENGRQIFGSAFVSREYAVQFGLCEYVKALEGPDRHARVGSNPLTAKGLRTLSERACDIVISNADAAKLRGSSANLSFLKQCRVIIVLD